MRHLRMLAVGAMVMCCSTSLLAAETETPCAEGSPTCRKPWSGFRESLVLGLDVGGGSVTTTNDLSNASGAKATKLASTALTAMVFAGYPLDRRFALGMANSITYVGATTGQDSTRSSATLVYQPALMGIFYPSATLPVSIAARVGWAWSTIDVGEERRSTSGVSFGGRLAFDFVSRTRDRGLFFPSAYLGFDAAPWLRGTADVAGVGRSERGVMTMFTVGLSLRLN